MPKAAKRNADHAQRHNTPTIDNVDLGDAVADELALPFDRISLEMIFRGLYHFSVANSKGKADDPIKYFAAPENQDLGVVKYLRKPVSRLDLSPWTVPSQTLVQLP